MDITERLWQRIAASLDPQENGCWLWRGRLNSCGYGFLFADGRMRVAHRVVYELLNGTVAAGLEIDHLCRIRICCNPDHMEQVTHRENIRRAVAVNPAFGQRNREKTHCSKGHEFTPSNTYHMKDGGRQCRMCTRLRSYQRYATHYKERADSRIMSNPAA